MIRPSKAVIAGAAVAGLLTVSVAVRAYAVTTLSNPGISLQTMADAEKGKHACKGQNDCKGQGGCKTSDAGCKGKNSCKAKVGCATDGTKPLNFSNQGIAARLSEQLGLLCGVGVSTLGPHPKAEVTRSSTDQASGAKR